LESKDIGFRKAEFVATTEFLSAPWEQLQNPGSTLKPWEQLLQNPESSQPTLPNLHNQ